MGLYLGLYLGLYAGLILAFGSALDFEDAPRHIQPMMTKPYQIA